MYTNPPSRYLLLNSGYVMISGNLTFDSDQLTLTCISTGGPATTVSWTRDNVDITGEQNETVLNDPETAQYTHTLTVTTAGEYTCTVTNNKPSSASASITLAGLCNVVNNHLFYEKLLSILASVSVTSLSTSLTVSWVPAQGVNITAYSISYVNVNNTNCFETMCEVNDSGGAETINMLTGLEEGTLYSITVSLNWDLGTQENTITAATVAIC